MASKIDKEVLKSPDMFVSTSDKIFNYIEHHLKTFLAVIGLVLVAAVVYVGMGYVNASHEQQAAEALYGPEAELKKAETDVQGDPAAVKPVARAADYAKDFAPAVEKIKAQIKAHAGTKAALVSALNLSYFLTQQKEFAKALEVLDIPKYNPGPSELLGGFWLMHRGFVLLENNQVDPAIAAYESVIKSETLKAFQPEALLKLGICYELKGDIVKARETYEKLGREFPKTEASATAEQYLRLLELNAHKQG